MILLEDFNMIKYILLTIP